MTTRQVIVEEQPYYRGTKRISWSAILAGAFVGVGLGFLLNLFGVAIGLSAFSMTESGSLSLMLGGLFGLIIATIVAMFFGGLTAGYLGRQYVPRRNLGLVYGFTTWSVSIILTAILGAYVGNYVNDYSTNITRQSVTVTQEKVVTKSTNAATTEQKVASMPTKDASTGIAVGAFVIFALFFIGAFSSCLGAHYGMTCRCGEEE